MNDDDKIIRKYTQTELRTGTERIITTPYPVTTSRLLQLLNDLNKEALVYGCFYSYKGTEK